MSTRRDSAPGERAPAPLLWLLFAIVVLAVSNGRWIVPAAAWLGPAFMLHFLDTSRRWSGLGLGLTASFFVWSFSWQGMIPAPGWLYFMVTAIYAVVYFLPYIAHRFLASGSAAFRSSLVFPTAWVGVDLLFQRYVSPYGSWTAVAYTQLDFLALTQLASITGSFGVTFLVTWFASTLAWLWRSGPTVRRLRTAALSYGIPFAAVMALGASRLAIVEFASETLRVAAITPTEKLATEFAAAFQAALTAGTLSDTQTTELIDAATRLNSDLVDRTRQAADEDVDVIAWSETAARVTQSGEADLIKGGRQLVDAYGVVLVLAYATWDPESTPPLGNKLAILHPGATSAVHYRKARPVIGAEAPFLAGRDSAVAIIETPDGRLAAAICHDLDFPDLIREAGRKNVRLMVGPSADWPQIEDMHAGMAKLRAVENGFALVRPTSGGRTIAVDAYGREMTWVDQDGVRITDVSAAGVPTAYARIGDLFAWLCLGGFLLLAVGRLADQRRLSTPRAQ